MKFEPLFHGQRMLYIRELDELDVKEFAEGYVIATFNAGKIKIVPKLSDIDDSEFEVYQLLLNRISDENAIYDSIDEIRDSFVLNITGTWLFTNDNKTMEYLFKAGARTLEMRELEKQVKSGEFFIQNSSSDKVEQIIDMFLNTRQGGQEDGYINLAQSNIFITTTTKVSFTGRVSRTFLETMYGIKRQPLR